MKTKKINNESNKFLKIVELYGWDKYYFIGCLIEFYGQELLSIWLEAASEEILKFNHKKEYRDKWRKDNPDKIKEYKKNYNLKKKNSGKNDV